MTAASPRGVGVGAAPSRADARRRVRIGPLWMDALTCEQALDEVEALVAARRGGAVFTPNVDHVVLASADDAFRAAYARASLSLVDSTILLWTSRVGRTPLPEKLSGSDLVLPIANRAAACGWRVYLLGGAPGVAERVAERLSAIPGFTVVGMDAPAIDVTAPAGGAPESVERLRAARPDLVLVALGSPKQEIWIDMVRDAIRPTVAIGVGASFDFVAGRVRRCPAWVSRAGLEWLYRLVQEPGRLWRRYLVQDAKFFGIAARTLATPRHRRTQRWAPDEPRA